MRIEVRLFASLRDRLPDAPRGRGAVELPEGATVGDLIEKLAIPERQAQMVLVNGARVARDRPTRAALRLAAGDVVAIFPPLAGG